MHPTHYGHTLLGAFVGRSVGIDEFGRLTGLATRFTKTFSGRQVFSRRPKLFETPGRRVALRGDVTGVLRTQRDSEEGRSNT